MVVTWYATKYWRIPSPNVCVDSQPMTILIMAELTKINDIIQVEESHGESSLACSLPWGNSREAAACQLGRQPSPEPGYTCALPFISHSPEWWEINFATALWAGKYTE